LLRRSSAKTALLIDASGHLVTSVGQRPEVDLQGFLALCAGDYAASREMAVMLGEHNFQSLYLESENHNLYVSELSPGLLLVLLFGRDTTLGLVRWAVRKYFRELVRALDATRKRSEVRRAQYVTAPATTGDLDDALDALFDA
jgi:predicted regulator of Ras-like GTPase activity (Roadblock/LC7/MglB family)